MNITENRLIHRTADGGSLFQPGSGVGSEEIAELSVIFIYEPANLPGLRIVLRAESALLPLPGGGQRLGYIFSMTGLDGIADDKGKPIRGIVLGTDIPIEETVVMDALAKGENPVLAVFHQQNDLLDDFCQNSERLQTYKEKRLLINEVADPGISGDSSGRL